MNKTVVHKLNKATIDFAPVVVPLRDKYQWRKARGHCCTVELQNRPNLLASGW